MGNREADAAETKLNYTLLKVMRDRIQEKQERIIENKPFQLNS